MKRIGNIYEKICNRGNILHAHNKAKRGKWHYTEVKYVENNLDECVNNIQKMLEEKRYVLTADDYAFELINDKGKERELYKLPYYPHRIIQWSIVNVILHVFMKHYIGDTYASIKGRGVHKAMNKVKRALRHHKDDTQYCLKIDIKKFYPNINNNILMRKIERKFKDKDFLDLMRMIIFSRGEKGQPIGSLLSQYLGNFYLSSFDHYCKERLRLKYYYRYMDDIVILHSSKEYLHNLKRTFDRILDKHFDLKIKENWQVFPVDSRGIDYVGYRIFRDKIILRKRIYKNARYSFSRKRLHKAHASYYGWCKHASVKMFMKKHKVIERLKHLKEVKNVSTIQINK